jgi:hypothetical protein
MNTGERIPKEQRDDMARVAFAVARHLPAAEATSSVVGMFKVSGTTARRLIRRGQFLGSPAVLDKGRAQG